MLTYDQRKQDYAKIDSKDFIKNFINGEFETLKEEFQEDLISYIEMYKNKLEDCTKTIKLLKEEIDSKTF